MSLNLVYDLNNSETLSLFIYWDRETEREREGERAQQGRDRGAERESQAGSMLLALCWAQSHKPWDHDLSQNQELDAQSTEPPRCPNSETLKELRTNSSILFFRMNYTRICATAADLRNYNKDHMASKA